jgi:hypothetical protein
LQVAELFDAGMTGRSSTFAGRLRALWDFEISGCLHMLLALIAHFLRWGHDNSSHFGSSSRPQLRFTMSCKKRTLAHRQEPSGKRRRTYSSQRSHISTMDPQEWSWPKRIDEFASGPYAKCLGATDITGAELTWPSSLRGSKSWLRI